MWERFKQWLLNIIFYEEEVEIEVKPEKKEANSRNTHLGAQANQSVQKQFVQPQPKTQMPKAQSSTYAKDQVQSEAKVVYQYPRNEQHNFQFPVIPDESSNQNRKIRLVQKDTQGNNQKRREKQAEKQTEGRSILHQRHAQKEMENVPTFMRNERYLERQERSKQEVGQEEVKDTVLEKTVPVVKQKPDLSQSTRPEELDRLFQRIKEKPINEEVVDESKNLQATTDLLHSSDEITPDVQEKSVTAKEETAAPPKEEKTSSNDEITLDMVTEMMSDFDKENDVDEPVESDVEEATTGMQAAFQEARAPEEPIVRQAQQVAKPVKQTEKKVVPDYLLNDPVEATDTDEDWVIEQQILLEQTLEHFNIDAEVVNITQGPAVTRFEIQPALGVKVSRVRNLSDDFKLNMAAKDIRIEAPIPGKNTIGIEVPNRSPQVVTLQQLIETDAFKEAKSPLSVALGLTIEGDPLITDIGDMPHGLIAGATGSGKSVCINTILLSLLYKAHHDEVKFLLIDPKMVELAPYNGIPHLISPVITDVKAANMALKWAVQEMEDRYEQFVEARVRNITSYNRKMTEEQTEKMPFIVIVIDELADLMMAAPQDVEDSICRIAQKARACGIHLLVATQRPSVDVVTGLIKANIPTRIAFSVSSQVDSRTMIDSVGAERLLGKGDMLFVENGANKSLRLQGPFVSDEEIDRVASFMRQTAEPNYLFEQEQLLLDLEEEAEDELLHEVIHFVVENGQASTSLLQRRFRIGYNRAARLIDTLEMKGIVSEQNGSKPREVLINATQLKQ
ncbi:MAG TPA: DNA translocase FtsK [Pseudogracilibacillus sp.]|nr:DNA translocase FtsK [Pseudogracilibacillus sp.]